MNADKRIERLERLIQTATMNEAALLHRVEKLEDLLGQRTVEVNSLSLIVHKQREKIEQVFNSLASIAKDLASDMRRLPDQLTRH